MTIYKTGDVIVVPFFFTDNSKAKPRPAVIISTPAFNGSHDQVIAFMITTAARTQWASDIPIKHVGDCGLRIASSVRMKCFTLDTRLIKKHIGRMHKSDWTSVKNKLHHVIAL